MTKQSIIRHRISSNKYASQHREKLKQYAKEYYYSHKEQCKQRCYKWQQEHYEQFRKQQNKYAAKRYNKGRGLENNLFLDNIIDEEVDYHHITNINIVAIPRDIHTLYGGMDRDSHRFMVRQIVSQLYF